MIQIVTDRESDRLRIDGNVYEGADCQVDGEESRFFLTVTSRDVDRAILTHSFSQLPLDVYSIRLSMADQISHKPIFKYVVLRNALAPPISYRSPEISYGLVYGMSDWAEGYSVDAHQKTLGRLLEQHDPLIQWNQDHESMDVIFSVTSLETSFSDLLDSIESLLIELDKRADTLLLTNKEGRSVVAAFNFPEHVKTSCEQYLWYFVQFLRDLGVEANATLTHRAGQVLFSITPNDEKDALHTIRTALEEYLNLPSSLIANTTSESIAVQRLEANILRLRADLRLASAELQAKALLAVAGSFGFDGHLPRDVFRKGMIDKSLWEMLIKTAHDLRKKAVVGDQMWRERKIPDLEVANDAELTLQTISTSWRELLQHVFCFSRKVVLSQLQGGFSGAQVFRAYVRPPFEHGGAEGQWLLKVSNSPSKLHREALAHKAMLHGGLDFARMVPLLWSEVMVVGRGAAIAYQFAIDTKEASEMLDDAGNLKLVCDRLRLIFERFYRGRRQERSIIQTLCEQWGPTRETIAKVWPLIPKSHVKGFLKDYASNQTSSLFAENIEYQRCLIHGDLHLSNIMMGSVDVLIDFARSSDGPISVDAAKLISDFLLRLPSTRDDELPNWDSKDGVMGEILSTIRDPFNFEQGDEQLFSLFLILHLAVALQYNDIDKDTKAWVRGALSKVTL